MKTILTAIDYIKKGISICIFPEGTRNKGEELSVLPFKEGSFKIASKTGCAVVPISMNNTAEYLKIIFRRSRRHTLFLNTENPIYYKDLDKDTQKHFGTYCQNIIQETINRNSAML